MNRVSRLNAQLFSHADLKEQLACKHRISHLFEQKKLIKGKVDLNINRNKRRSDGRKKAEAPAADFLHKGPEVASSLVTGFV